MMGRGLTCRQRKPSFAPAVINFSLLVLELIIAAGWRAGTIYLPDHTQYDVFTDAASSLEFNQQTIKTFNAARPHICVIPPNPYVKYKNLGTEC